MPQLGFFPYKKHCIGKDRPPLTEREASRVGKREQDVSGLVIVALSGMFYEPGETGRVGSEIKRWSGGGGDTQEEDEEGAWTPSDSASLEQAHETGEWRGSGVSC